MMNRIHQKDDEKMTKEQIKKQNRNVKLKKLEQNAFAAYQC